MKKEIEEILKRVDDAVKALEKVEDSNKDIFEDVGVLVSDTAQTLFCDKEKREAEKKDTINTIASLLTKVNSL